MHGRSDLVYNWSFMGWSLDAICIVKNYIAEPKYSDTMDPSSFYELKLMVTYFGDVRKSC